MKVRLKGGKLLDEQGTEIGRLVGEPVFELYELEPVEQLAIEGATSEVDGPATVWAHYLDVMGSRRRDLDPATRAVIRDALKVASVDECCRAVDGCRASGFHMGQNDRGKKYNRVSQILRGKRGIRTTREQIDLFLDIADKSPASGSESSVDAGRLSDAKRSLLAAWEFPQSGQARKQAEMSAAWLAQHGFVVTNDPENGRPTVTRVAA